MCIVASFFPGTCPPGICLDMSGPDARILKVALVPSPPRGNPYWDPTCTRPWPGILSSTPIRSASWYFLSFDSRNKTGNRAVGRVLVFVVLDHAAIRPLTTPLPNCRFRLPDSDVAIPAREGNSNNGCNFRSKINQKNSCLGQAPSL